MSVTLDDLLHHELDEFERQRKERGSPAAYFEAPDGSLFTLGPRRITIGPVQADDDEYLTSWAMANEEPA